MRFGEIKVFLKLVRDVEEFFGSPVNGENIVLENNPYKIRFSTGYESTFRSFDSKVDIGSGSIYIALDCENGCEVLSTFKDFLIKKGYPEDIFEYNYEDCSCETFLDEWESKGFREFRFYGDACFEPCNDLCLNGFDLDMTKSVFSSCLKAICTHLSLEDTSGSIENSLCICDISSLILGYYDVDYSVLCVSLLFENEDVAFNFVNHWSNDDDLFLSAWEELKGDKYDITECIKEKENLVYMFDYDTNMDVTKEGCILVGFIAYNPKNEDDISSNYEDDDIEDSWDLWA